MANVVEQIRDKLEEKLLASTTLTSGDRLRYIFDVERNDSRIIGDGYGIRPLSATTPDGVTKFYTLDQDFEIILTKRVPRQQDDDDAIESILALYDRVDLFFKEVLNTQLDLGFVLVVFQQAIDEPEILGEGAYAVLRLQVTVKYRQSVV